MDWWGEMVLEDDLIKSNRSVDPTHWWQSAVVWCRRRQSVHQMLKRVGNVIETPVAYDQLTAKQNLNYIAKSAGWWNLMPLVRHCRLLV